MKQKVNRLCIACRNAAHTVLCVWVVWLCLCMHTTYAASPCFTTDDTLGCVPYAVTMNECTRGGNSIQYNFDAEHSSRYGFSNTHIYDKPGRYKVGQTIQGVDDAVYRYIVVIDAVAPQYRVLLCENRTIALEMTDTQFQVYSIDYGDGSPLVETGRNTTVRHTYVDTSPRTIVVTGRFLSGGCPTPSTQQVSPVNNLSFERFFKVINKQDKPNVFTFEMQPSAHLSYEFLSDAGQVVKSFQYTDAFQSFVLENVQGGCFHYVPKTVCGEPLGGSELCLGNLDYELSDTSVALRWQANDLNLMSHYEVFRDGSLLARLPGNVAPEYNDATVKCGKNYCYEVVTKLKDSSSYRTERCMKAVSNRIPDRPYDIESSFSDDNQLFISWVVPSNSSFKKAQLKSLLSNEIVLDAHELLYTSKSYSKACYTLQYLDSCDKVSELVPEICPIVIDAKPEGQGIYAIDWNEYTPVVGDMRYELYEDGKLIYSGTANGFKTLEKDTVHQIKNFHVLGFTPAGTQVKSNTVRLEQEMKVLFPTAFSPNEDGLNDVFAPKNRFVKSFKMAVYNIWGELVFTSSGVQDVWKAENHSNGTYQYIAEAEDFLGNRKEFRGQVTIVR